MTVTLNFTEPGSLPVDVRTLQPAVVLGLSKSEIGKLSLAVGNRMVALADLCTVKVSSRGEDELVFEGATARLTYAGDCMHGGRLVIAGDAGGAAGAGMHAGTLEILGSAGDCLGLGMQGGMLRVHDRAGDWCGAGQPGHAHGMCGGMILVGGNSGRETGAGLRRGLIFVAGDAGECAGAGMLAGSLFIAGRAGKGASLGMRRGSLVAGRLDSLLPGFRPAGPADDEWLRVYFRYLDHAGIVAPAAWLRRGPLRFTGDTLALGKGEILVYDFAE
jgi:formylmethanofuran dehydrogenase subunit C